MPSSKHVTVDGPNIREPRAHVNWHVAPCSWGVAAHEDEPVVGGWIAWHIVSSTAEGGENTHTIHTCTYTHIHIDIHAYTHTRINADTHTKKDRRTI